MVTINRTYNELNLITIVVLSILTGIAVPVMLFIPLILLLFMVINNETSKRKNKTIQPAEETCRAFMKYSQDAVLVLNKNKFIIDANDNAKIMTGYHHRELISTNIIDIIDFDGDWEPENKNGFQCVLIQEKIITRKDGSKCHAQINIQLLDGANYLVTARDISAHKAIEKQKNMEKLLSDSIINGLPGIFYLRDQSGNLLRWNKNAEDFFAHVTNRSSTWRISDFIDESQKEFIAKKQEYINKKGYAELVVQLKNKEGKNIPYYFIGIKLNFDGEEFVIGMGIDITERMNAENKLAERTEELRKLSTHIEDIREEERTRVSSQIHDELGQQLTRLKMDAGLIIKNNAINKGNITERVTEMVNIIDYTISAVRRISSELRPGILDDLGLMAAVEWQGQEFEKRTGTTLVFNSNLYDTNPDSSLSTVIFRIYQKILIIINKHSKIDLVETSLEIHDNNLTLVVRDNGNSFDLEEVKNMSSMDFLSIKEKVALFNGKLNVDCDKKRGTIITVLVPIINK
jgi:PAS domain S-box-containing protein